MKLELSNDNKHYEPHPVIFFLPLYLDVNLAIDPSSPFHFNTLLKLLSHKVFF
jgi:hypothetical protein